MNGNYSTDHSALCERHLQECAAAEVYVQVTPLGTPIKMGLSVSEMEGERDTIFKETKKAGIFITLDTNCGPLLLRNVEFLVFFENIPEVLLSSPLLQSFGCDLDKHLAAVRDTFHDADFSQIGFSGTLEQTAAPPSSKPPRLSTVLLDRSGNA